MIEYLFTVVQLNEDWGSAALETVQVISVEAKNFDDAFEKGRQYVNKTYTDLTKTVFFVPVGETTRL